MKKAFRVVVSFLMMLVCLVGIIPEKAEAASWPSLSSSKYCEFVAAKTFNAYRDPGLKTRGTASPAKSYGAAVYKGDVCRIYEVTSSYVKLGYPTSSGYKTAYVSRSNVIPASGVQATTKAGAEVTVYSTPGGSKYGYTEVGDTVYKVGTSGNYTAIIYTAKSKSGNRAFKFGYVKTSQYNSSLTGKSSGSSGGKTSGSSAQTKWLAGVPVYKQTDSRWKNVMIGNKNIGQVGCLVCSMAMSESYRLQREITPKQMREQSTFAGSNGNDLVWPSRYKTMCSGVKLDKLYNAINSGKAVIVGGSNSNGWHWVVVTGYQNANPGSLKRSNFSINDPMGRDSNLEQFLKRFPNNVTMKTY